jgi:AbrB family looped-hinge helix DNA binding protein
VAILQRPAARIGPTLAEDRDSRSIIAGETDILITRNVRKPDWIDSMEFARITTKGQMTIPKRIREAAGLETGDVVAFEAEGGRVSFRKIASGEEAQLNGAHGSLEEWNSPEDNDAWRAL